jgi:ribosome-binding factor A
VKANFMGQFKSKDRRGGSSAKPSRDAGPSQRQLRAGELVRHALAEILREEEVADPALVGTSITVTEVRMSPDLKHAVCFVEPLGGVRATEIVSGLNRAAKFLRGRLGRHVELKFTPDLKFIHDQSFDAAAHIGSLFLNPVVQQDLAKPDDADDEGDA